MDQHGLDTNRCVYIEQNTLIKGKRHLDLGYNGIGFSLVYGPKRNTLTPRNCDVFLHLNK